MATVRARDITPGTVVNIEPNSHYVTEANRPAVTYEYVLVDSVNGGWADGLARPGEVVLYSAASLAEPMILPGDTELELVDTEAGQ
jgi:hypothetical protein